MDVILITVSIFEDVVGGIVWVGHDQVWFQNRLFRKWIVCDLV